MECGMRSAWAVETIAHEQRTLDSPTQTWHRIYNKIMIGLDISYIVSTRDLLKEILRKMLPATKLQGIVLH